MGEKLPRRFGDYVLIKLLGSGAMGDVHLARRVDAPPGAARALVIKRLHAELASDPAFVSRFHHEAEVATRIDNPFVARVHAVGSVGDTLFIAMEHVAGWPLSAVLKARRETGEPISLASAIELIDDLLQGLDAIHSAQDASGSSLQIVHRDVAPKNVMVGEDGRVRLIDLGIGKSSLKSWKTRTGAVMGSPGYMAPEQIRAAEVDHRSDLYAAGAILYEVLTLEPFVDRGSIPLMLTAALEPSERRPSQRRPELPGELDSLFARAVALAPAARFSSAREMRARLREIVPPRDAGAPLETLIGEMIRHDSGASSADVAKLLADTLVEHAFPDAPHESITEPRSPRPALDLPPPPPSRAYLRWVSQALIAASLLGGGVMIGRSTRAPDSEVEVVKGVVPQPTVAARPAPSSPPTLAPAPAPPSADSALATPPAPPVTPVTPAEKKPLRRVEHGVAPPVVAPPAAPEPAAAVPLRPLDNREIRARATALIARVGTLRAKLKPGDPAIARTEQLTVSLVMLSTRGGPADVKSLDTIERELDQLLATP